MKYDSKQLVFRRVRGRIIPIRISSERKIEAAKGGGMVAAGYGIAATSGRAYRNIMKAASKFGKSAHKLEGIIKNRAKAPQMDLFEDVAAKKYADELFAQSAKAIRNAGNLYKGSMVVSGALAGAGAERIYRALRGGKKKDSNSLATGASAAAGATIAFSFGAYPKLTVQKILRNAGKPENLKKVQSFLKKSLKAGL